MSAAIHSTGHLFVLHGLLESVRHDYAIVPTSRYGSLRESWTGLLGDDREAHRPRDWAQRACEFAPSALTDHIWLLSVSGLGATDRVLALVDRTSRLVQEIGRRATESRIGRVRPLVVIPVVGTDGGGMGDQRGRLLRKLIPALQQEAAAAGVDVALVVKDTSMYAAAQHVRRKLRSWHLEPELRTEAERLGGLARNGELALFIGAGVSMGAGLPGWGALLQELVGEASDLAVAEFDSMSPLDQAQLVQQVVAGTVEDARVELGRRIAEILERHEQPALGHVLLSALGCQEAITTNYDRLYETAIAAGGGQVATVLPKQAVKGAERWVLKMHGDVDLPSSIVLSREQFVSYDAQSRPSSAMLQSLFITRHVLVVGASLTDDNVIRLAYEVNEYRSKSGHRGAYGTVVDVRDRPLMKELWKGQFIWLTMPNARGEADDGQRIRAMEIFLDAVGAFAASDSSWLLDKRFNGLLPRHSRDIAHAARALYGALRERVSDDPVWSPLQEALLALGADPARGTTALNERASVSRET